MIKYSIAMSIRILCILRCCSSTAGGSRCSPPARSSSPMSPWCSRTWPARRGVSPCCARVRSCPALPRPSSGRRHGRRADRAWFRRARCRVIGGLGAPPAQGTCSRAECREPAAWRINWRNPRIHTDGRSKTWLACDEHVEYLRGFLEARAFPRDGLAVRRRFGDSGCLGRRPRVNEWRFVLSRSGRDTSP